jgi:bromodomain-containing factor 1
VNGKPVDNVPDVPDVPVVPVVPNEPVVPSEFVGNANAGNKLDTETHIEPTSTSVPLPLPLPLAAPLPNVAALLNPASPAPLPNVAALLNPASPAPGPNLEGARIEPVESAAESNIHASLEAGAPQTSVAADSIISQQSEPVETASELVEIPTTEPFLVAQPTSDVRDETQEVRALGGSMKDVELTDAPGLDISMSEADPPLSEETREAADQADVKIDVDGGADTDGDMMDLSRNASHSPQQTQPQASDEPSSTQLPLPTAETSASQSQLPTSSSAMELTTATEEPSRPGPDSIFGQVRPREEEDDEDGPTAKRTKVENAEFKVPVAPHAEATPTTQPPPPTFDSSPLAVNQTKYLLDSVRKTKKIKAAGPFLVPVDPVALNIPAYSEKVKHPMDLSTIEDKLKKEAYLSANDFWTDIELMVNNCEFFNGKEHGFTVLGYNLRAYLQKLVATMPKASAVVQPKPKKIIALPKPSLPRRESRAATAKSPVTTAKPKDEHKPYLDSNGMPIIRRDSNANDRPKREIIKPPPRDLPYSGARPKKKKFQVELKFCEYVLKELNKPKHKTVSWPFMAPVDPVALNIPTYHKIIKKPMDFKTIGNNLQAGTYANSKEFYNDSKLVFANCYKFNISGDDVYRMGKQCEEAFDEIWETKDHWIAENQPVSEPVSDEEEEEESEPEEDNDEKMRRMMEIQQQIAALSAEAMNLTSTAVAIKPPAKAASGKKTKTKTAIPKLKRVSTGNAVVSKSRPSKSTAKKSVPPKKLTLDQKRYVSEGITQLDEPSMRRAVQIIRNGVPSLKVRIALLYRALHDELFDDEMDQNMFGRVIRLSVAILFSLSCQKCLADASFL